MDFLFKFHKELAYTLLIVNLLSGILLLVAWKKTGLRDKKWVKITSYIAHGLVAIQVLTGMWLLLGTDRNPPAEHVMYGVIAFTVVGMLHSYRSENSKMYMVWGFGGVLLAVLAFRAIMVVSS
jgi:heme A synthase